MKHIDKLHLRRTALHEEISLINTRYKQGNLHDEARIRALIELVSLRKKLAEIQHEIIQAIVSQVTA